MKLNCHCGSIEAEINASINELAKIERLENSSIQNKEKKNRKFKKKRYFRRN